MTRAEYRERERLDSTINESDQIGSRATSIKNRIDATRKSLSDIIKSAQNRVVTTYQRA